MINDYKLVYLSEDSLVGQDIDLANIVAKKYVPV